MIGLASPAAAQEAGEAEETQESGRGLGNSRSHIDAEFTEVHVHSPIRALTGVIEVASSEVIDELGASECAAKGESGVCQVTKLLDIS